MKDVLFFIGNPVLSVLFWLALTVLLLYIARPHAHNAIRAFSRVIYNAMRLASHSLLFAEKRLRRRNRDVLLSAGAEAVERQIEREFHRVGTVVERDLHGYPALHRSLADIVIKIDEDYRESTEVPPTPPEWINAVEAVANIPSSGDSMVAKMLGEINKTLVGSQKEAMDEYRKASRVRNSILRKMAPYWRRMRKTVDDVGKTIMGLQERGRIIDIRMEEYEGILSKTDRFERTLSSSAMTQFVISGVVLLIAIGGAFINFNLIALPMSEMVGGGSYIGNYKTADVAALVIILVELAMGLYLMESLRITRLFPVIGALDDKMRTRMIWISFSILLVLAGVESALAFMRDRIATDMQALRQTLAGVEAVEPVVSWIPTVGQMVMGFILPFALTFVAIPLESFVHSSRTVLGTLLAILLNWLAFLLRFLGSLFRHLGALLIYSYDLLIFIPLSIEKLVHDSRKKNGDRTELSKEATL
jgi:hypothetical protein